MNKTLSASDTNPRTSLEFTALVLRNIPEELREDLEPVLELNFKRAMTSQRHSCAEEVISGRFDISEEARNHIHSAIMNTGFPESWEERANKQRLSVKQKQLLQSLEQEAADYVAEYGGEEVYVEVHTDELRTAKSLERRGLVTLRGDYEAKVNRKPLI